MYKTNINMLILIIMVLTFSCPAYIEDSLSSLLRSLDSVNKKLEKVASEHKAVNLKVDSLKRKLEKQKREFDSLIKLIENPASKEKERSNYSGYHSYPFPFKIDKLFRAVKKWESADWKRFLIMIGIIALLIIILAIYGKKTPNQNKGDAYGNAEEKTETQDEVQAGKE